MRLVQPVRNEEVFDIDLLEPTAKPTQIGERLYLISQQGASSTAIADYWQHKEATSRYVIAQILLKPTVVSLVRRMLRAQFDGLRVSEEELTELLRAEVIKRDALEGEKAIAAAKLLKRTARKREKQKASAAPDIGSVPEVLPPAPAMTS